VEFLSKKTWTRMNADDADMKPESHEGRKVKGIARKK
jgi:hypothetical protein